MQTPLVGVLRFWGSEWCGRSHWFDEFAGSEFGRRRRPRAQRGVRLMDEPSNPTLSARMQTPLVGVLRFWGSGWCGRSHWFDEFAGSEFGRRRRPRAQRGVRLRDEPSNPTLSARNANAPRGCFAFLGERVVWTKPLVRRIRRERIRTPKAAASAARGEAQG